MSEESKRHAFPYIQPSQAQKHVTHNETVRLLDVLVQMSEISDQIEEPQVTHRKLTVTLSPLMQKGSGLGERIKSHILKTMHGGILPRKKGGGFMWRQRTV